MSASEKAVRWGARLPVVREPSECGAPAMSPDYGVKRRHGHRSACADWSDRSERLRRFGRIPDPRKTLMDQIWLFFDDRFVKSAKQAGDALRVRVVGVVELAAEVLA